uniref:RNase H type-1 domain-containing protein n=1 Tax=Cannabis sativa TaxID=3483 RepID=A0A803PBH6_CANSA
MAAPHGMYKLNVDDALDVNNQMMGIGGVVRNSYGQVIAAISSPLKGNLTVKEIEAKAISYCLSWLKHINCPIHLLESDALIVSQNVNNPQHHYGRFHDLINDIIYQMSSFSGISISYVHRSANSAAHGLVRYALRVDTDIVWRAVCPSPIEAVIVNELVH